MDAHPTFPLLSLPDDEILQTIRVMDLEQILKFSLISERCKGLVSSLKIKGTSFTVSIENSITIYIGTVSRRMNLSYYTEQDMYWGMGAYGRKKKLTAPQTVNVGEYDPIVSDNTTLFWENNTLTMQYWLKHLQNIFNYPKTDYIWFTTDSFEFDIDDIKEVFGTTTTVIILNTGYVAFKRSNIQNFLAIEVLIIMAENIQDLKIPNSLLMQNLVKLNIESSLDEPTNITLNDLLLINSKVISVENPQLPQKLLNNFIKLWQRGSNPHMEYLCVDDFDGEENKEQIIMKGITYEVNPSDRVRKFKSVGFGYPREVSGGIDIYRMDGVKATITHLKSGTFFTWHMHVWFDHCIC